MYVVSAHGQEKKFETRAEAAECARKLSSEHYGTVEVSNGRATLVYRGGNLTMLTENTRRR